LDIRDIVLREKNISMTDVLGIISFVCDTTKEQILASMDREIENATLSQIEKLLGERRNGKPLAYITKKKEFYSQQFFVDKHVLVPRPETEILVEEALNILAKRKDMTGILDMGTGSGAIGLTIAQRALKCVVCADVSEKALGVARKNAHAMGISDRVHLLCSNLFGGISVGVRFDMILANLPYVADEERGMLMADVRDFEPEKALYGGKGGIEIYQEFLRFAHLYLKNEGYILCEVGGYRQAQAIKNILESAGFSVNIKNDYSEQERVVVGLWINLS
jgi:release factor glutamine methyltransferase